MKKFIYECLSWIAERQIYRLLPGIKEELQEYMEKSETTGTQFITLYMAVTDILKYKPKVILESGTGASTIILAAAVQKIERESVDGWSGRIVSMESMRVWYETAKKLLPEKYSRTVELIYGPREKYEFEFFRAYIHSSIPELNYSFVFIDGPAYRDERGMSFNGDVFRALEVSDNTKIRGVIDGRMSTAFVMQTIYGKKNLRYFKLMHACRFSASRLENLHIKRASDFRTSLSGMLRFEKFKS